MADVTVMDYNELLSYWQTFNGSMSQQEIDDWIAVANSYNVSEMQAIEDLTRMGDVPLVVNKSVDGSYTISGFASKVQVTQPSYYTDVNSNLATTSRSTITRAASRSADANGKIKLSTTPASGSFGQNATYYLANVGQAVAAVSTGISLGKVIDSALYNINPDYWDSIGMSSLNPETWNSITSGDTSLGAGLFNFVFGLNPDTGESQAYMDANAFAYMANVLSANGWFQYSNVYPTHQTSGTVHITSVADLYSCFTDVARASGWIVDINPTVQNVISNFAITHIGERAICRFSSSGVQFNGIVAGITAIPQRIGDEITLGTRIENDTHLYLYGNSRGTTTTINIYDSSIGEGSTEGRFNNIGSWFESGFGYFTCNVNVDAAAPTGVSDQTSATLPDTSTWSSPSATLSSLQSQYPDMFNNALVWDNVQPDGTNNQLVYVPVAWPDISSYNDTQPTGTTATQTNPKISDATETLVKTLTEVLQQTLTQTQTGTLIPPSNPVDTGTGDSPSIAAPTGEATALWSVYHPTQTEINSFGAWLWGSPFTTNINKLFQNPIEGVISLHKVFATPVDSGTSTIVVGTLDSNVSSATVTQQYVYIDCGSVKVNEDFVNVFDYPPYTQISLYLPFIGIVPLDVNDIMRSTVNVTYGVDVFTGACLAIVEVTRDSHTVTMYQYAGVCAVSYPLGNVQHSQMVSGLLAIAGGVASMVASGGVSAPAALTVAAGAASASKSTVGRSGGFSGNAGAMGGKKPYLIIQRPQTRVAETFPSLAGYPTNKSGKLSSFSGQVKVTYVHVENMPATESELEEIEKLLKSGVLV